MDSPPSLEREEEVFILDLGDGSNVFHPDWVSRVRGAVDEVSQATGPRALVTVSSGKVWASGLDLDYLRANPDATPSLLTAVHDLLAAVLTAPMFTVAAISGHCFAAGAMLAVAHDRRLIQRERGYFCLPEVDLDISFSKGMTSLLSARLPGQTCHEAIVTGQRYGAEEAYGAGIVQELVDSERLRDHAVEWARDSIHRASDSLRVTKERLYRYTLEALRESAAETVTNSEFEVAFQRLKERRSPLDSRASFSSSSQGVSGQTREGARPKPGSRRAG